MKIVVFTIGTQGDVRPFVALGRRLSTRGCSVTIATASRHKSLIEQSGLDFALLDSDIVDVMVEEHAAMKKGNQLLLGRKMALKLYSLIPIWIEQAKEAARDANLVIGSGSATLLGAAIAEKLGLPFVQAQFMPLSPSRFIPPVWPTPSFRMPGFANLWSTHLARFILWQCMSAPAGKLRRLLDLPSIGWLGPWSDRDPQGNPLYILYAFSQYLQPQPSDWPANQIQVTGNWFYDQASEWTPPADLLAFLDRGEKPIYIGFGSMISGDAENLTGTILRALHLTGRRAVIATGWGGLAHQATSPNDRIFFIDHAPHDWLFPRMSLAVHHGGAGTVAAASRAGLPQIIIPFVADQFFWRWRMKELGINPVILRRKTLTPDKLAKAVQYASTPGCIGRAARLGEQIRAEDGIGNAIRTLVEWGLLPPSVSHTAMRPAP